MGKLLANSWVRVLLWGITLGLATGVVKRNLPLEDKWIADIIGSVLWFLVVIFRLHIVPCQQQPKQKRDIKVL